jgi:hypothetical protein
MSKRTIRRKNPGSKQAMPIAAKPTERVTASDTVPNDPDAITNEFMRLAHEIRTLNTVIRDHQTTINGINGKIQSANNTGLQLIGQLNMLARVMRGMGMEPPTVDLSPPPPQGQSPAPMAPPAQKMPETPSPAEELQVEAQVLPSKVSQIRESLRR